MGKREDSERIKLRGRRGYLGDTGEMNVDGKAI